MGSFQKITYLIVSTLDQSYDRQLDGMKFDKVFEEKKISGGIEKDQL